jgi:hypothetical protein
LIMVRTQVAASVAAAEADQQRKRCIGRMTCKPPVSICQRFTASTLVLRAGCDALSVHLITAQMAGTLALGSGPLVVIGTLAIMIPWLAAQWEEYHTGLMLWVAGAPCTPTVMLCY